MKDRIVCGGYQPKGNNCPPPEPPNKGSAGKQYRPNQNSTIKLLTKKDACDKLKSMGINISHNQITRAASPNERGVRNLPFFPDPITGRLVIDESVLVRIYVEAQMAAIKNMP